MANNHEMIHRTITITKTCINYHFNGNGWTEEGACMPTWTLTTELMMEHFRAKEKSHV